MPEKPSRPGFTAPGVQPSPFATPENAGCLSNVLRIWWSGLGFFPFFLLAFKIGMARGFVLTLDDAFYAGFWVALVVIRVVDGTVLHGTMGTTGHDRPATRKDLVRYVALATLGVAAFWGVAHLIAFLRG